jgi:cob(I)alamin adenosyltransferase
MDDDALAPRLRQIQSDLFAVGAELATEAGKSLPASIGDDDVRRLERWIDEACEPVPPLRSFILPGGTEAAARLHLARTVCRRAERAVVALSRGQAVRGVVVVYLNRLSDLLFAVARLANHRTGVAEIPWKPGTS